MRKLLIITLSFLLILSFSFSVFAETNNDEKIDESKIEENEVLKAKKVYKEEIKKTSKVSINKYIKKDANIAKQNTKVIMDKSDDLEVIKKSFETPILIYDEQITVRYVEANVLSGTEFSEYAVSRLYVSSGSDQTIRNKTYAYAGITVSTTTVFNALYTEPGDGYTYYKAVSGERSWSTNNSVADGLGGYASKVHIRPLQMGKMLNGNLVYICVDPNQDEQIINWWSTLAYASNTKYYYPNPNIYTNASTIIAGTCGEWVEWTITFVNRHSPNPIVTTTDNFNTGWGENYMKGQNNLNVTNHFMKVFK